jgi:hypothetical protein
MDTPTRCRHRAAEIGPATVAVIDGLPRKRCFGCAPPRVGGFGLPDCHDPDRLEAVFATTVGDPSYRTIKGILAFGTETAPATRPTGAMPGRPSICSNPRRQAVPCRWWLPLAGGSQPRAVCNRWWLPLGWG